MEKADLKEKIKTNGKANATNGECAREREREREKDRRGNSCSVIFACVFPIKTFLR